MGGRTLALAAAALLSSASASSGLSLTFEPSTAAYSIGMDGTTWLNSDVYAIRQNGKLYTSANGLQLAGSAQTNGAAFGPFGAYTGYSVSWTIPAENNLPYVTNFYVFSSPAAIVFEQVFPNGASNMAIDQNATTGLDVSTAFPSFGPSLDSLDTPLSWLTNANCMCGGIVGKWTSKGVDKGAFGDNGGATVLFNSTGGTMVMSALSDTMVSHFTFAGSIGNVFAGGLSGRVSDVPAGFRHLSILVAGQGINNTMWTWGDMLLGYGGKRRTGILDDFQTSYLSYWTDNGAYYYYHTLNATDPLDGYESTMLAVKQYEITQLGLPVRTFQYDSWWYFKEGGTYGKGAVLLWEPMPIVFPDGLKPWLGLPVALHNRYFSRTNNYSSTYTFLTDSNPNTDLALPIDVNMFKHIMGKTVDGWAMTMYEQDWLITVYQGMDVCHSNVTAARDWLHAMGDAAASLNVTIQYCMPLPNHMLTSTAIQPVTNARASGDYHPGQDNWNIGLSSLFYQSIGIQPSKDDWWTTEVQPGSPYSDKPTEPNWQLQAIVTTLSTGPVGPSDMIGGTNASVVLSTCRAGDGLLLRPDRPAATMDAALLASFVDGNTPEVTHTYSAHAHEYAPVKDGAGIRWHYVLSTRLSAPFTIQYTDIGPTGGVTAFVAVDYFNPTAPIGSGSTYGILTPSTPITLGTGTAQPSAPSNALAIRYLILAPVLPGTGGWVLIGEAGKIAPMSRQRSSNVVLTSSGFSVAMHASGPGGANASVGYVHEGGKLAAGLSEAPRAVAVAESMRAVGMAPLEVPGESTITYLVVPPTGSAAAKALLGEGAAPGAVASVTCNVSGGGQFTLTCATGTGCTCN